MPKGYTSLSHVGGREWDACPIPHNNNARSILHIHVSHSGLVPYILYQTYGVLEVKIK